MLYNVNIENMITEVIFQVKSRHRFNGKKKLSVQETKFDTQELNIADLNNIQDETSEEFGLTEEQVQERIEKGLHNGAGGIKTKSEKQIILENTFTFFNTVNIILAILVILVGSYKNVLFMGVIISNALIGSIQEIRSKRIIDKLSLISAPKARVIRQGRVKSVPVEDIVMDDVMQLSSGNQICADALVLSGEVEVNESLITGESDPVTKTAGDHLLSGSFIVSGDCRAKVEHVGNENYANKIAGDAKYLKKPNSQILNSLNMIVKAVGFGIIPVGILLFVKQYFIMGDTIKNSVVSMVAALIGMIPEGLVLLTSVVFAVSVLRLSRHKTLVQELYCIETLARVDVLCLDKTGTITEGTMQVEEFVPFDGFTEEQMKEALCALTSSLNDDNPTFNAIADKLGRDSKWNCIETVPFSSARKWSGAEFEGKGTYIMGAGEFILGDKFDTIRDRVSQYTQRVLLLVRSDNKFEGKAVPDATECMGLVIISDKIREEAPHTLRYFADQGVDLKVISGDNAFTVSNIAKKAGLENADAYVDATTLETQEDIEEAAEKYSVFGRVTPQQKLQLVKALKAKGHTVAMTGDGVNDVLALKESDCSIAMASGSDAARTVSNLVLMDSNFASMPLVVKEGRRSINNLQRSASLFLTKTIFAIIIGIMFIFVDASYPFQPIQLTLISSLTIGVPSFILALESNKERVKGKFINNVISKSLPTALAMAMNIVLIILFQKCFGFSDSQVSTMAVIMTAMSGFILLLRLSFPFNFIRALLFVSMTTAFVVSAVFFQNLYALASLDVPMIVVLVPIAIFMIFFIMLLTHFTEKVLYSGKLRIKEKKHLTKNKDTD